MALIKFSGLISDIRGKLNGAIFARNHWGAYAKGYIYSANPETPQRKIYRDAFKIVSQRWKNITDSNRLTWEILAGTQVKSNALGDKYKPSAYSLFCSCNTNLSLCGQLIIDVANWDTNIIGLSDFETIITISPTFNINIDFSGQTTDDNTIHLIYATPELHLSVNYVKSPYRLISAIPANTADYYDITTDYINIFPSPAGNLKIAIKIRPINITSGFSSLSLRKFGLT